jgi:cytochrome oxidase assembly protein ShyY1
VRSWRFLVSRRWIVFFLVVVLLAYATWWLGRWQFHRLADRKHDNAVIIGNLHATPEDVTQVLAVGRPVPDADRWRNVRATGTYDDSHTVVIRYQTRNGDSGVDVVVPLVTADGTAVLVDRGWFATENSGAAHPDVPPAPSGQVTVGGWVRQDDGSSAGRVTDGSARSISSVEIAKTLPYPVFGGFVDATAEQPAAATALTPVEEPDLGNGPHFFYGLQWWFFGLLAIFGFGYLARDEWLMSTGRKPRPEPGQRAGPRAGQGRGQNVRSMPPSTGSITPVTNDAAGESRNAAARPNSSGSP